MPHQGSSNLHLPDCSEGSPSVGTLGDGLPLPPATVSKLCLPTLLSPWLTVILALFLKPFCLCLSAPSLGSNLSGMWLVDGRPSQALTSCSLDPGYRALGRRP
jgi:hypothetical protein